MFWKEQNCILQSLRMTLEDKGGGGTRALGMPLLALSEKKGMAVGTRRWMIHTTVTSLPSWEHCVRYT